MAELIPTEKPKRNRNWCFTINNWTPEEEADLRTLVPADAEYIVWGREEGDAEHTPHLQGFVKTKNEVSMKKLKKLGFARAHLEVMQGTHAAAIAYCKKDGDWEEYGNQPLQGFRTDLVAFKRQIELGKRPVEVAEDNEYFGSYVKYHRGFDNYHAHVQESKRLRLGFKPPQVYLRVGDPGIGKSRYVYDTHGYEHVYTWESDMGHFFDGYRGQSVVHFEDVQKGQIPPLAKFKRLLDGHPVRVSLKGSSCMWSPDYIYISSNHKPCTWYDYNDGDYEALMSRIKEGRLVYKDRPEEVFHTSSRFDAWLQAQEEH